MEWPPGAAGPEERRRHQRLKELYSEVVDLQADERERRLQAIGAEDPSLLAEVRSLLKEDEDGDTFAGTTAALASLALADLGLVQGERGYRLTRELGRGGMSVVYLAERADGEYRQLVAVKLLRPFPGPEALRRFRAERQILAHLVHPHIAKLLDGGSTAEGVPFLVMEYVEGKPIDDYCQARALPPRGRLELFRAVCLAVHYAHQNLVVHRDLKPANILVAADGSPKLLDFGIARILDPQLRPNGAETTWGLQPLTPAYASPEQLRGDPVATTSDVYALGVILFRLLTGKMPYRVDALSHSELTRVICENEPERPSDTLRGGQRGAARAPVSAELARDLDAIVLKALRKQPGERYASAAELAADIDRCLQGLPVTARAGTGLYRVRKFARRNARLLAAASIAALGLLVGLALSVHEARVATRRFNDLRQLANSFLFEFHDAIAPLPGSTRARALVVRHARHYLDRLAAEAGGDPQLHRELATAYQRVADVQGNPFNSNLGDVAGALESCRKALALRRDLVARSPDDPALQAELATSTIALGDILSVSGDKPGALAAYEETRASMSAALSRQPDAVATRDRLAAVLSRLGDLRRDNGDAAGALALYEQAVAALGPLPDGDPATAGPRRTLALARSKLGMVHQDRGDLAAALAEMEQARRLHRALAAEAPDDAARQRDVMIVEARIGDLAGNPALHSAGQPQRALEAFEASMAVAERLAQADPFNRQAQRDRAVSGLRLGNALDALGRTKDALRRVQEAQATFERLSAADPANVQVRRDVTIADEHAGLLLLKLDDVAGALRLQQRALRVREELAAADPGSRRAKSDVCWGHQSTGDALLRAGQARAALDHFRRALEILPALASPADPAVAAQHAHLLVRSGDAHAALAGRGGGAASRDWQAAEAAYREALGLAEDLDRRGLLKLDDRGLPERARSGLRACRRARGARPS